MTWNSSMYRVGGGWQDRRPAREVAAGVYAADFRPGLPGVFHVAVACGSLGLSVNNQEGLTVHVEDPSEGGPPPGLQAQGRGPGPSRRPVGSTRIESRSHAR